MHPEPKDKEKAPLPPSEEVQNAHAAGDGALERSGTPLEEPGEDDVRAEDQDHIPY